jgi:D-alanyl-D-alanine carboxypeptidase/D-alanyl-D-alanine-endopeptidase (penicillin-binding protein 4)
MRMIFLLIPALALAAVNWDSLLDQNGGSRVNFGATVDGAEPFARNEAEEYAPASTAKIFTAAAALAHLGPNYRYGTLVEWQPLDGGIAADLALVGVGDPSWGMTEFGENLKTRVTRIAQDLKRHGVRVIRGEISVTSEDPRWDSISIPEGWKPDDAEGCGGTLAQAFNMDINCSVLRITSESDYHWQTGADTPVELDLREGSSTKVTVKLERFADGRLGYRASGSWKRGSRPQDYTLPVWGTHGWIKNLLTEACREQGIRFEPAEGQVAPAARYSFLSLSPPLSDLLKPFLKNSINFMGDAFLKAVAIRAKRPEADLLAGGNAAIRDYLLSLGVPDEFRLHDGSGLSRTARVTPRMMRAFLQKVRNEPYFPALWNALAIAGADGTLKNRMKGTAADGRLRGKTGTLDGVYNLAGFVPGRNGYEPFLLLTKTTTAQSATARAAADRVGAKLASITPKSRDVEEVIDPFPIFVPEHAGFDQP